MNDEEKKERQRQHVRDWRAKQGEEYKAKQRERQKKWRKDNPEKYKEWMYWNRVKKLYGVDKETYATMLEQQGGSCALCGRDKHEHYKRFAIDHNHETGEVRGLLCRRCNLLVGYANDDPELLARAAKYLGLEV